MYFLFLPFSFKISVKSLIYFSLLTFLFCILEIKEMITKPDDVTVSTDYVFLHFNSAA